MIGFNWDNLLTVTSVLTSEKIDKERLKLLLDYDKGWTSKTIDSLFIRKILTLDEYKHYLDEYIKREEENLKYEKQKREDAEKMNNFSPTIYYNLNSFN